MNPLAWTAPAPLSAEPDRPSRPWMERLPVVLLSLAASGLAGLVGLVLNLQARTTRLEATLEANLEALRRQTDRIERKLDAQAEAARGR